MAKVDVAELMGLVPVEMRNDTAHPNWQDPALVAALKETQVGRLVLHQQDAVGTTCVDAVDVQHREGPFMNKKRGSAPQSATKWGGQFHIH